MRHYTFEKEIAGQTRWDRVFAYRDGPKRWMDIGGVLVLAPLVVPLVAVIWMLVRMGGGAGFYRHRRIGLNGQAFWCWKVCTMVPNANTRLTAHLLMYPDAAREWAQSYKLMNDPRVTRLGRFLRKTSMDELPQFWNVLRGDMSLVGPRPVPEVEMVEYTGYDWAYLNLRPGITGAWQVAGRGGANYRERVQMDVRYLMGVSAKTDLLIMWRTVGAVLRGTGT